MMKTIAAATAALIAVPAVAQVAPAAPAASLGFAPATMLRTGLAIPMRTSEELTTKNKVLRVGQRVQLETSEDVRVNGQVVIPAGTPGLGEIATVRNKGMWGKSGYFSGRVLWIRVGDRQMRMAGTFDDKGRAGGGAAAATSAIVFLPAGFFMTGTSAYLPKGAPVAAFLDEDVPVTLSGAAQAAPLVAIPQPAPAVVPATLTTASPVGH